MTDDAKPPPQMTGCVCEQGGARFIEFESRDVGCAVTEGRFAHVTLNRCRTCGRTWLRYLVEYEACSRSDRWARGLINDDAVKTITPKTAVAHLNGLEWYLYGGSYFDGISGRRSGPVSSALPALASNLYDTVHPGSQRPRSLARLCDHRGPNLLGDRFWRRFG